MELDLQEHKEKYFIKPSLSNFVITENGFLIDSSLGNSLGVWDFQTGKCVNFFYELLKSSEFSVIEMQKNIVLLNNSSEVRFYDTIKHEFLSETFKI
jgi:hypothetical protein